MPEDRAESIEKAIEEFHTGGVVDVLGWKSLTVAGRVVVTAICDEIKTRSVFIADVTGLNPNVLFELGYAVGRKKRIWLLPNRDIEHAKKEFDRFQLLTTIGYQPYSNSSDITGKFYRDEPYKKVGHKLYDECCFVYSAVLDSRQLMASALFCSFGRGPRVRANPT